MTAGLSQAGMALFTPLNVDQTVENRPAARGKIPRPYSAATLRRSGSLISISCSKENVISNGNRRRGQQYLECFSEQTVYVAGGGDLFGARTA
jgi:hypothetical protein